jgi:hypothetical protein
MGNHNSKSSKLKCIKLIEYVFVGINVIVFFKSSSLLCYVLMYIDEGTINL